MPDTPAPKLPVPEDLRERFPLDRPLHETVCDRQSLDAEALTFRWQDGTTERFTFRDVQAASSDIARQLVEAGLERRQRVAVVLPPCPLNPVMHVALSRVGAVSVPLSPLMGPDALGPRLKASGAVLAVVHPSKAAAVEEAAPQVARWVSDGRIPKAPASEAFAVDESGPVEYGRERLVERPMSMFFTSGTTAQPKAALLPDRVIPGRMGAFLAAHPGYLERAPEERRFWTPAEWAWIGGLHDSVFAPWAAGAPVFAYERNGPFDAAEAARLIAEAGVKSAFFPPTALRKWRAAGAPTPPLASVHTAGEPLAADLARWTADAFKAHVSRVYGLTEAGAVLVTSWEDPEDAGAVPAPGADVQVLTPALKPCPPGKKGEVCVKRGAPTVMLGYVVEDCIRIPVDTQDWLHTGDVGVYDERGRIHVLGRLDDVIKTRGYRVAPGEVEAEIARHDAVAECAVVGVPDEAIGHAIRAYVVLRTGVAAEDGVARALRDFVRERLAAHLVPQEIAFVDALPTTETGKVVRRALR